MSEQESNGPEPNQKSQRNGTARESDGYPHTEIYKHLAAALDDTREIQAIQHERRKLMSAVLLAIGGLAVFKIPDLILQEESGCNWSRGLGLIAMFLFFAGVCVFIVAGYLLYSDSRKARDAVRAMVKSEKEAKELVPPRSTYLLWKDLSFDDLEKGTLTGLGKNPWASLCGRVLDAIELQHSLNRFQYKRMTRARMLIGLGTIVLILGIGCGIVCEVSTGNTEVVNGIGDGNETGEESEGGSD